MVGSVTAAPALPIWHWVPDGCAPPTMIELLQEDYDILATRVNTTDPTKVALYGTITAACASNLWNPHQDLMAAQLMIYAAPGLGNSEWAWRYGEIERNLLLARFRRYLTHFNIEAKHIQAYEARILPAPAPPTSEVRDYAAMCEKLELSMKSMFQSSQGQNVAFLAALRELSGKASALSAQITAGNPSLTNFEVGKMMAGVSFGLSEPDD